MKIKAEAYDSKEGLRTHTTDLGEDWAASGNPQSSRGQSLQLLHQHAQKSIEKKNRCFKHIRPKIQNKSPHMPQCSQGWVGKRDSRSTESRLTFSPSHS